MEERRKCNRMKLISQIVIKRIDEEKPDELAEINILDTAGHLDMDEFYLQKLDLRIAGIHSLCYQQGTVEENTQGLEKVICNPYIHIISHPGDGTAKLQFEPLVLAAKEHHTLLEINNSSLKPCRGKLEARGNNLEILRLCK